MLSTLYMLHKANQQIWLTFNTTVASQYFQNFATIAKLGVISFLNVESIHKISLVLFTPQ